MSKPSSLTLLAIAGLALATALPATARAGVSLDVGIHIGSPPPPPVFVFEDEPGVVVIPRTRVYYVPGPSFDLFRYGRFWYINNGGWWYRSSHYRGPFVYIDYGRVPVTILRVPKKYHRHPLGGPPGHTGIHPGRGRGSDRDVKADKPAGPEKRAKVEKKEWKRKK